MKLKDENWDFVVDFTSYNQQDMKMAVDCLKGKVGLYIYISSDSIYSVCENVEEKKGPRREEDAIRPKDEMESMKLISLDEYGHGKFCCEEVLQEQFYNPPSNDKTLAIPFTCLRLPDVFGPFDRTDRHWKYQLWLKICNQFPVDCPKQSGNKPLSFIFSYDVATTLISILNLDPQLLVGQVFNLAAEETPTLKEYLEMVANCIHVSPQFRDVDEEIDSMGSTDSYEQFLPSVSFGPIDNSKAKRVLGFKPTPMKEAIKITCDWFEDAWNLYYEEVPLDSFENGEMRKLIKKAYKNKL